MLWDEPGSSWKSRRALPPHDIHMCCNVNSKSSNQHPIVFQLWLMWLATLSLPKSIPVINSEAQNFEMKGCSEWYCIWTHYACVVPGSCKGTRGPFCSSSSVQNGLRVRRQLCPPALPSCPGQSEQHDNIASLNLVFVSFLFLQYFCCDQCLGEQLYDLRSLYFLQIRDNPNKVMLFYYWFFFNLLIDGLLAWLTFWVID